MGGTGSKQEDQIITAAIEQATGAKFTYVPYKGGGDVAAQLVGGHINSTVNNPIEAVSQWRGGELRPLCVFGAERASSRSRRQVGRHPDLQGERAATIEYQMLRGIFSTPGVDQEEVDFYVDLFEKVRETPEWQEFMANGAFNDDLHDRRRVQDLARRRPPTQHKELMTKAGFSPGPTEPRRAPAPRRRSRLPARAIRGGAQDHRKPRTRRRQREHRLDRGRWSWSSRRCSWRSAALVMWDSWRVGVGWASDGPQAGLLPVLRRPDHVHRERA